MKLETTSMFAEIGGPLSKSIVQPAFPAVPKDLLDRLAEIFPDSLPYEADYTARGIDHMFGAQLVIRRLRDEYMRQNSLGPYHAAKA